MPVSWSHISVVSGEFYMLSKYLFIASVMVHFIEMLVDAVGVGILEYFDFCNIFYKRSLILERM